MKYTLSGFADEIDSSVSKQFDGLDALGMKWFEIRGTSISDESSAMSSKVGLKTGFSRTTKSFCVSL